MNATETSNETSSFDLLLSSAKRVLAATSPPTTAAEGLVSDATVLTFIVVYRWLAIVMCLVPLVFTLLNAGVYWQLRKASHAIHLLAICAGDGMCTVMFLVLFLTALWQPPDSPIYQMVRWYLVTYFASSSRRAAICLNVPVTLERFLAVAFPLKDFSKRVSGKPRLTVLAVFLLTFAAHVYVLLEYHVVIEADGKGRTVRTSISINNSYIFLVTANVVTVLFSYLPVVLGLMLNLALVIVLHRHRTSTKGLRLSAGGMKPSQPLEKSMSSEVSVVSKQLVSNTTSSVLVTSHQDINRKSEVMKRDRSHDTQSVTTMVMIFSFVYMATALPRLVHFSARSLIPQYGPSAQEHNLDTVLDIVTQIITHLAEVQQFCLSCIYSRQFRIGASRLFVVRYFCRSWAMRQDLSSSGTTSESSYIQNKAKSIGNKE